MSATRDGKMWRCQFYYKDWQGVSHKKNKRGFKTKAEAEQWERDFLQQQKNLDINFENFVEIYYEDMEHRLRENTMRTKKFIIDLKIIPYFKKKRMCDIKASDIRAWQNMLMKKGYLETYLKTVNNQLSAIFNYAVRYYDLKDNPCRKAGSIGKSSAGEREFWTKQEFKQFLATVEDKPETKIAFLILVSELSAESNWLKEQTEILTEDKEKLLSENEKLENQQKKLQQEINKMVQSKEIMERNIHAYDEDAKWQLPEPGALMSAKAYRDKNAMPLVEKLKEVVKSLTIKCVQLAEQVKKLIVKVDGQQKQISRLTDKVMAQSDTIDKLQEKVSDLGRLEHYFGREQVRSIVEQSKAMEQAERTNKRPKRTFEMSR